MTHKQRVMLVKYHNLCSTHNKQNFFVLKHESLFLLLLDNTVTISPLQYSQFRNAYHTSFIMDYILYIPDLVLKKVGTERKMLSFKTHLLNLEYITRNWTCVNYCWKANKIMHLLVAFLLKNYNHPGVNSAN